MGPFSENLVINTITELFLKGNLDCKTCCHRPVPYSTAVVITPSMMLDPATGLSTTSSILQYAATKEDVGAKFACMSTHELTNQEADLEPFPIHCE